MIDGGPLCGHRADVLHRTFGFEHEVPGRGAGLGRHRLGGVEQLIVVMDLKGQSDPRRLLAVEDLGKEDGGGCDLRSADVLLHPGVAAAGMEAQVEEAGVESGGSPGEPQVADEGQVHAGAHGRPVDGGNRRQR